MKGFEKDRYEIRLLRNAYASHNRRVSEAIDSIRFYSQDKYEMSLTTVKRIQFAVEMLEEDERFIIENEVILGKEGKWYRTFCSPSKYYRCRRKAYRDFLRCL